MADIVSSMCFVIIGAIVLITSLYTMKGVEIMEFTLNAKFLPIFSSILLIVFASNTLITSIHQFIKYKKTRVPTISTSKIENNEREKYLRVFLVILASIVYVIFFNMLGFIFSTILILIILMILFREQSWKYIFISSVVVTLVCYFLFAKILKVYLPSFLLF